jgi:hypothetical protein
MSAPAPLNSKRPVVSEHYDEAVFTDPTENFKRLLMLYSVDQTEREGDAAGMVREVDAFHSRIFFLILLFFLFPLSFAMQNIIEVDKSIQMNISSLILSWNFGSNDFSYDHISTFD